MFKKIKERNMHFTIIAFVLGMFLGVNLTFSAIAGEPALKYLDYFHKVYQLINSNFVEKPDTEKVFYGAIRGMIKSLGDPFTRFLDESSMSQLKEMTSGKFVGVGIEITMRNGEVVVISPIDDSPAMKEGILSGDIIMKVNDIYLKGKKLSDIIKLIKGLPGSSVKLFIKREGYDEYIPFNIKRAPIKIKSVKYGIIKNEKIGLIKIKNFGHDTAKDVSNALKSFNKKSIDKVIIDLRYNPGGLLTSAINISDFFLDKGKVVVSTKGRKRYAKERFYKSMSEKLFKGKVFVLVNRGSASASEIVSAAIRDNKRGMLIGEKTFGKGSVQNTFSLGKKIGVAITIAKYYTPSGICIHKKGIKPDYKVEQSKISKTDRKAILRIRKEKILDRFVNKKTVYNDESKESFSKHLKVKNISISKNTSDFIFKRQVYRFKKSPLYDLEFDKQLVTAISKIK